MKALQKSTLYLAILLLCGCSISGISVSLTAISDACAFATVTVPILEASGVLPTGIGNIILAYTGAVSNAASQSSAELLSTDPPAVQATKIISYFSAVAVPALGPTVGPEVQSIVTAINAAVDLFVQQFKSPRAQAALKSGALNHQKLSMGDRHTLGSLKSKFDATSAKCKGLIK